MVYLCRLHHYNTTPQNLNKVSLRDMLIEPAIYKTQDLNKHKLGIYRFSFSDRKVGMGVSGQRMGVLVFFLKDFECESGLPIQSGNKQF